MKALIEVTKVIVNESTMYPICPQCGHQIEPCDIPDDDEWVVECGNCDSRYIAKKDTSYSTELIEEVPQ
jgi:hypothetical protein